MLSRGLETNLRDAKRELERATIENLIALCRAYLKLLAEARDELYQLPSTLTLDIKPATSVTHQEICANRKSVRALIERITAERERAQELLLRFTAISGYGAVETLNRLRYLGRGNWELRAGGAGFDGATATERLTLAETVESASRLRRREYVAP